MAKYLYRDCFLTVRHLHVYGIGYVRELPLVREKGDFIFPVIPLVANKKPTGTENGNWDSSSHEGFVML